jgi:hypothetical protein
MALYTVHGQTTGQDPDAHLIVSPRTWNWWVHPEAQ